MRQDPLDRPGPAASWMALVPNSFRTDPCSRPRRAAGFAPGPGALLLRADRLGGGAAAGPLRPIGPERLRELRRMIQDGSYPLDRNAELGLLRLFLDPGPPPGR